MGISRQQALDCFASDDLIGIGMEADAVRRTLHPEAVVTYSLEATIALDSPTQALDAHFASALDLDVSAILIKSSPTHDLTHHEHILRTLKHTASHLCLKLSVDSVAYVAQASSLPIAETLARLHQAGLDTVSGDASGANLDVHRAAHALGIPTSASLALAVDPSHSDLADSLEAIRTLQDQTHGFLAFTLHTSPSPSGRDLDDPTAVEYLRTLAITRMFLDNIPHTEADPAQGLKVLQMSLRFGANDTGPLQTPAAPEAEIRRLLRDAGFKPVQRDTLYRTLFLI